MIRDQCHKLGCPELYSHTHTSGAEAPSGGGRQGLRDRRAPRGGCGALTEPLTVLKLREIPIKNTGIGAPRPSGRKGAVQAPEALPGRPPLPWRSGAGPPPPTPRVI